MGWYKRSFLLGVVLLFQATLSLADGDHCNPKTMLGSLLQKTETLYQKAENRYSQFLLPTRYKDFNLSQFEISKESYLQQFKTHPDLKIEMPRALEDQLALIDASGELKHQFQISKLPGFQTKDPVTLKKISKAMQSKFETSHWWKRGLSKKKPSVADTERLFSQLYAIEYGSAIPFKEFYQTWKNPRYQAVAARLYQEKKSAEGLRSLLTEEEIAKITAWTRIKKTAKAVILFPPKISFSENELFNIGLQGEAETTRWLKTKFKLKVRYQQMRPLLLSGFSVVSYHMHHVAKLKQEKEDNLRAEAMKKEIKEGVKASDKVIQPNKTETEILIEAMLEDEAKKLGRPLSAEEKRDFETKYREMLGENEF